MSGFSLEALVPGLRVIGGLRRPVGIGAEARFERDILAQALAPLVAQVRTRVHVLVRAAESVALRRDSGSSEQQVRYDQDADEIARQIRQMEIQYEEQVPESALLRLSKRAAADATDAQKEDLLGVIRKRVPGVDPFKSEPYLEGALDRSARESVRRIRRMTARQFRKLEAEVRSAVRRGMRSEELAEHIRSVFVDRNTPTSEVRKAERRAALIARDQIGTVVSEVQEARQEKLGVTEYIWRTSNDERVRGNPAGRYPRAIPSHHAREGRRFRWDTPPNEDETDGHPGTPPLCRCYAEPVLDDADLGDSNAPSADPLSFLR